MPAVTLSRHAPETELLDPIRDVSHAILQRLSPYILDAGMVKPAFWSLHHLAQLKHPHPGDLARRLGVTPATCTASIDQLVEQGYVARRPSETDRRQIVLLVTPKGHRALEEVWGKFDRSLREVLVGIPPKDIVTTARTIATIAERLRNYGGGAEGRA